MLADALLYDYAHWLMTPFVFLGLHKLDGLVKSPLDAKYSQI